VLQNGEKPNTVLKRKMTASLNFYRLKEKFNSK